MSKAVFLTLGAHTIELRQLMALASEFYAKATVFRPVDGDCELQWPSADRDVAVLFANCTSDADVIGFTDALRSFYRGEQEVGA